MQKYWLKKEGKKSLIIYALGWACTPDAVAHIDIPEQDALCLFDYREIAPLVPEDFTAYDKITLVAWSFGVWVAERVAGLLPLSRALAFNGTPIPISESYGMHPRIVALTIQGLARVGIDAFNEKTYGGKTNIPPTNFPIRTLEEKIDELRFLTECAQENSAEIISWNKAFISSRDLIFPPKSMEAYWCSRGLGTPLDTPHYPFADPTTLRDELTE